jgi:basic membrane lipoprotein Med (substrate-binding protein (PBP1-ABC) superfamily)|tara:strand:+ start:127 stop:330 length:204 start_codon:yes stop_codon:yes gene_type:complete
MSRIQQRIEKMKLRNLMNYVVEEKEAIIEHKVQDEIEKALWEIKDSMDIPTEEIQLAVESRKNCKTR